MSKDKTKTSGRKNKKNSCRQGLKRLAACAKPHSKSIILLAVAVILETAALTLAPLASKNIIDSISGSESGNIDFEYILFQCSVLLGLYITGNSSQWADNRLSVALSQSIVLELRERSQKKIGRLPLEFIDSHPAGDILSRVTNDMTTLSNTLDTTVTKMTAQLLTIAGILTAMLVLNPVLALVFIVMIPVSFFSMTLITATTRRLFKKQQQKVGSLNAFMNDIYTNHVLMQAFSYEDKAAEIFDGLNAEVQKNYTRSRFFSGCIMPVSKLINNMAYIALCVLSAVLLLKGKMTLGEFQAFIIYANMIAMPIQNMSANFNNFQMGIAAAERVFEFLEEEEEPEEKNKKTLELSKVRGAVSFEHVEFGYTQDRKLMSDVTFDAPAGKTVAIVGGSGAGKTTVINLIMRFYEIQGGRITLDGTDISEYTRESLRSAFGMVLQDSWIFEGTIAENIGYGREGASREEIIKAAETVGCDTFIEKLPAGYDTAVSPDGGRLSSGELQLLCIARVVLSNPAILILDEATSQVDSKTEAMLTAAMEALMKNRTGFIIAHRLFTIRNADKILFMQDGDIKETGNHAELMAKNGLYAELYRNISD